MPEKGEPKKIHEFIFRIPGMEKNAPDWEVRMVFNEYGWRLYAGANLLGDCDRRGIPQLDKILDQSWAEAPYKLRKYIEHLWYSASDGKLTDDEIQDGFNRLTDWIKRVNEEVPKGKLWEGVAI